VGPIGRSLGHGHDLQETLFPSSFTPSEQDFTIRFPEEDKVDGITQCVLNVLRALLNWKGVGSQVSKNYHKKET
jgi:hypothetical protein